MVSGKITSGVTLAALASARDVPQAVKDLMDSVTSQGRCNNVLQDGFLSADDSDYNYCYCGDHIDDLGIMYLQGQGANLANMDVDCDGAADGPGNDGRCGSSDDTQYETAFKDDVQAFGIDDLNAYVHDYVVLGNYGEADGYTTFDPSQNGVQPLSVVAVVCGDKLVYGIWGDTNGDDGNPLVGETSLSLATHCYGDSINGNSGHDEPDVFYIAFTGDDAVPGDLLNWQAQSSDEFQESLQTFGDTLLDRLSK